MRRREFVTLLGGAAVAPAVLYPHSASAQQDGRVRRVALANQATENQPGVQGAIAAFREALAKFGWIEGRNLLIDVRYGGLDRDRIGTQAAELVRLAPDVIVTGGAVPTGFMQRVTQTIPIVMTGGGDPIRFGFVKSIARPEGNITGFANLYPSIGGKWLELLKEAVPSVKRVAQIIDAGTPSPTYEDAIDAAASSLGLQVVKTPASNTVELVRLIDGFAAEPNGGLLIMPLTTHHDTIIQLAMTHRLPSVFANRADTIAGGLISYGSDVDDRWRRAAGYVDRILRGARVGDLPIQYPTKFELVINLKTAKAIGLTIPDTFLLRADELIE